MNRKTGLIVTIAVFVVLVVGAYFAISAYSDSRKMVPPTEPTPAPSAAQTAVPPSEADASEAPAEQTAEPAKTSNYPKEIDFKLETLDGRTVSLSDYAGKQAVVVNFWATWCPPCRSELPDFNEQAAAYSEDKVVFLMVNLTDGSRDTVDIVKKFISDNQYTFKNVLLDKQLTAADAYAVRGIPSTFFINKDGYIVQSYEGAIDAQTLKAGIDLALQ